MTKNYHVGDKVRMPFLGKTLSGKIIGIGTNGRPIIRWESGSVTTPNEKDLPDIEHA